MLKSEFEVEETRDDGELSGIVTVHLQSKLPSGIELTQMLEMLTSTMTKNSKVLSTSLKLIIDQKMTTLDKKIQSGYS